MSTSTSEQRVINATIGDTGRIKIYEELEGGKGREIFFRPHRYTPEHFEPLSIWLELSAGGVRYRSSLRDLSQSGLGLIWPSSRKPKVGDILKDIKLCFDQQVAYEGGAIVSVIRQDTDGLLVGLDLQDHLIKIDALLQTRDLKSYHLKGEAPFGGIARPWQCEGHAQFKSQVGELRLFLEDWERHFEEIDQRASWDLMRLDDEHPTRLALAELISRDFMPQFLMQTELIFSEVCTLNQEEQKSLRAYSQRYLDTYFMSAPWMHRARTKPLGYPGDYEVMNHIYGSKLQGRSLLGQAINYATLHSPAAAAVRNRKDMLKQQLQLLSAQHAGRKGSFRVLSVAAGPAQEIYELLSESTSLPTTLDIVLFDQDPAALAFAYGRLKKLVEQRWSDKVRLVYLHDSIRRLLEDRDIFSGFGEFDMVICSGLYDYLRHPTAVKLTAHMHRYLTDGGKAFIGNMVPSNPSRWIMEHHLDWHLIYRNHEEILSFAREACPVASHRIITEPTGVNPFVEITRNVLH